MYFDMVRTSLFIKILFIGDVGTQFYIILRGEVSVKIPTTFDIEMCIEDLLFYFI